MMFGSFQQSMNKYEKYISCCGFVLITQWFSNFNNFKKYQKTFFFLVKFLQIILCQTSITGTIFMSREYEKTSYNPCKNNKCSF